MNHEYTIDSSFYLYVIMHQQLDKIYLQHQVFNKPFFMNLKIFHFIFVKKIKKILNPIISLIGEKFTN
jgi:hypothetical protein